MLLAGSQANTNDMPLRLNQPNAYQSNWDLSTKYQQDEIIFQDMTKDGGTKNKYNVDGYEMRPPDAEAAENNYASGKYYERDLAYLLENVNSRELQPSVRSVNGKFSNGNVTKVFASNRSPVTIKLIKKCFCLEEFRPDLSHHKENQKNSQRFEVGISPGNHRRIFMCPPLQRPGRKLQST